MLMMYRAPFLRRFQSLQKWRTFATSLIDTSVAQQLNDRGLIRVQGSDSVAFLQGLITNDMAHFQSGASAIYSMFLNTKGRVMYDSIIYQTLNPDTFHIECDKTGVPGLIRHLKMYRLRKKVNIDELDNFKLWVVFDKDIEKGSEIGLLKRVKDSLSGKTEFQDELSSSHQDRFIVISSSSAENNVIMYKDPRMPQLGVRVVAPCKKDVINLLNIVESETYRSLRYRLGVGEGMKELPLDNCFPLEVNCDYLHGVSFHKGCYIGQELTARTHHTGVVRKRLMPLMFSSTVCDVDLSKVQITTQENKAVGKVRGVEGTVGLGLLRIAEVLSAKSLTLGDTNVQTMKPTWWPQEAPRDIRN